MIGSSVTESGVSSVSNGLTGVGAGTAEPGCAPEEGTVAEPLFGTSGTHCCCGWVGWICLNAGCGFSAGCAYCCDSAGGAGWVDGDSLA